MTRARDLANLGSINLSNTNAAGYLGIGAEL